MGLKNSLRFVLTYRAWWATKHALLNLKNFSHSIEKTEYHSFLGETKVHSKWTKNARATSNPKGACIVVCCRGCYLCWLQRHRLIQPHSQAAL